MLMIGRYDDTLGLQLIQGKLRYVNSYFIGYLKSVFFMMIDLFLVS